MQHCCVTINLIVKQTISNKLIMYKQMIWAIFIAVLFFTSCTSSKNIVYLQKMQTGVKYPYTDRNEATIRRDDRLSITISNKNPELAIPFNIHGGTFKVGNEGDVETDASTKINEKGYRVDIYGDIDFPILGVIHVEGHTISELKELIKEKIEKGNYMKDPLVSIEFLNFKYTVLGAVGHNGTFTVDGERITLLEAIANAGNLTAKARMDRVAVIREVNGEREMFMHDLRSMDLFESPAFYLQQNDVVYVEPKYLKTDHEDRGWKVTTILLSVVTAVASILWAIK